MPELVAFIPNCCVIAVVFKFLLFLDLVAHYFLLTFFPFPSACPYSPSPHQMFFLDPRSPALPPPLGKRSQRCMSWGMSQRESYGSTDTSPSWKREARPSRVCPPWARSPWTCSGSTSASKRSEVWHRWERMSEPTRRHHSEGLPAGFFVQTQTLFFFLP